LAVVYGRRRLGKSRLIRESLDMSRTVYYVGDDREAALQRRALSREISRLLPGFERVTYPDWDSLLSRWWQEARPGWTLVIDELPALVSVSPELPSLLQKHVDELGACHLLLCGSSQRLMQGLALDRTAPLFGRSQELFRVGPLSAGWIQRSTPSLDAARAVEAWAVWGGVPRYWELAAQHPDLDEGIRELVLDPLGVLYDEPAALLLDDLRDTVQSLSILEVIANGCHRMSEIGARLAKPATSLMRPLQRLIELGYVRRDQPFGSLPRDSKRSLYRLADPFLRFWFRYVSPNRSSLELRYLDPVVEMVKRTRGEFTSWAWEELARQSLPALDLFDTHWNVAAPWWGPGMDGRPLELDVVSESLDGASVLLGSVKWEDKTDIRRELQSLQAAAVRLPLVRQRPVYVVVFVQAAGRPRPEVVGPGAVLEALRR
jgi:hypothetical protein